MTLASVRAFERRAPLRPLRFPGGEHGARWYETMT